MTTHTELVQWAQSELADQPVVDWMIAGGITIISMWQGCHDISWLCWIADHLGFPNPRPALRRHIADRALTFIPAAPQVVTEIRAAVQADTRDQTRGESIYDFVRGRRNSISEAHRVLGRLMLLEGDDRMWFAMRALMNAVGLAASPVETSPAFMSAAEAELETARQLLQSLHSASAVDARLAELIGGRR